MEIFMQVQLYESPILSPTKPRQLTMVKDTETTFTDEDYVEESDPGDTYYWYDGGRKCNVL